MIHEYNNANQTRWDHGEFKVQLMAVNNPRPIGFCDGTDEDEVELRGIAERENVDGCPIRKKALKTGRGIWTLGETASNPEEQLDY